MEDFQVPPQSNAAGCVIKGAKLILSCNGNHDFYLVYHMDKRQAAAAKDQKQIGLVQQMASKLVWAPSTVDGSQSGSRCTFVSGNLCKVKSS